MRLEQGAVAGHHSEGPLLDGEGNRAVKSNNKIPFQLLQLHVDREWVPDEIALCHPNFTKTRNLKA